MVYKNSTIPQLVMHDFFLFPSTKPIKPEVRKMKVGRQNKQEWCIILAVTAERAILKVRDS